MKNRVRSKILIEAGKEYNWLTAVEYRKVKSGKYVRGMWLCRCRCGKETFARPWDLKHLRSSSCGCKNRGLNRTIREQIIALRRQDLTLQEIANQLGLSRQRVSQLELSALELGLLRREP